MILLWGGDQSIIVIPGLGATECPFQCDSRPFWMYMQDVAAFDERSGWQNHTYFLDSASSRSSKRMKFTQARTRIITATFTSISET